MVEITQSDTDSNPSERIAARVPRRYGSELRVTRSEYRGRTYVHIREWRDERPGKGIALSEAEAAQVASGIDEALGLK